MQDKNSEFSEVYRENYKQVFSFILSISYNYHLSEEVTQAAFIKAYEKLESVREKAKIPLWLNKIAYNLFIDIKRKKSLEQPLHLQPCCYRASNRLKTACLFLPRIIKTSGEQ